LPIWTFLMAACILVPSAGVEAQANAATQRTTRMGVYTREQWMRGRDVYAGMCAGCHPAVTHVGPVFSALWAGKKLSELFGFIKERMPKNDPGSLSWEDYVDAIAYILRLNGMPVGMEDLPVDSMALTRIRIDSSLAAPPAPAPVR
jgi:mono/diheme cytochrome c family protein